MTPEQQIAERYGAVVGEGVKVRQMPAGYRATNVNYKWCPRANQLVSDMTTEERKKAFTGMGRFKKNTDIAPRIKELNDKGRTPEEIAAELNRDKSTILRHMRNNGIEPHGKPKIDREAQALEIRRLAASGMSRRDIRRAMQCSSTTIIKAIGRVK